MDRYGEEFRDALETDPSLCIAKSSLMEALKSNSRDREAPAVVTARGIFENIESSTKQRIGKSIEKLELKRPGNPKFSEARVFTDNEEMVMAESINQVSLCGFPFGYDAGETPEACASRFVTARWKSFVGFELDEWKPTDEATAAAFKACGSPHGRQRSPEISR